MGASAQQLLSCIIYELYYGSSVEVDPRTESPWWLPLYNYRLFVLNPNVTRLLLCIVRITNGKSFRFSSDILRAWAGIQTGLAVGWLGERETVTA